MHFFTKSTNFHFHHRLVVHIRKAIVNMKVSGFCYDMHFRYRLPLINISLIFPIRIEIIYGSHSLYNVLTVFSLHFTKIMLPMLKLETNYGIHELLLKFTVSKLYTFWYKLSAVKLYRYIASEKKNHKDIHL